MHPERGSPPYDGPGATASRTLRVIAWDFDGVLNRNIVDGRFVWADRFEADIGQSVAEFTKSIFAGDFDKVITGEEDLRDRVSAWAGKVGHSGSPDDLLAYWFAKDALPDPEMTGLIGALSAKGVRQVIVTNNEALRALYIEREMGYSSRVEAVFASGRMGVRKPDPIFFARVTDRLGVAPEAMLLVDDSAANVEAALSLGWQAFHFTDATKGEVTTYLKSLT